MVKFMKDAFQITIKEGARCVFEYKENKDQKYIFDVLGDKEYEGTSFDFYINDGDVEVFFEIKFTENGFGKAKADDRHVCKVQQYIELLPRGLRDKVDESSFFKYYQLFRNIIRAKNENKYVIFVTDANNPSTNKQIEDFQTSFESDLDSKHVVFKTWQELKESYPYPGKLPFQFKALW